MRRHMRDRMRRNGNRRNDRGRVPQPDWHSQRRPDRVRTWRRMERGDLGRRENRRFLHHRLRRRLQRRLLGVRGSGQSMAVLLGLSVRFGQRCRGLLFASFFLGGLAVFFPRWASQAFAQQLRDILVDRTGVGLLLRDAEFRQQVQNRARFYLELPRQFIDPDFLHTYGRTLSRFPLRQRPQPAPFAPASMTARQFSVEPPGGKP